MVFTACKNAIFTGLFLFFWMKMMIFLILIIYFTNIFQTHFWSDSTPSPAPAVAPAPTARLWGWHPLPPAEGDDYVNRRPNTLRSPVITGLLPMCGCAPDRKMQHEVQHAPGASMYTCVPWCNAVKSSLLSNCLPCCFCGITPWTLVKGVTPQNTTRRF